MASVYEPLLGQSSENSGGPTGRRRDQLYRDLYSHWLNKGTACVIGNMMVDLFITAFIGLSALFLLGGAVDYRALWYHTRHPQCEDGTRNSAALYETDCYGDRPLDPHRLLHMPRFLAFVFSACLVVWCFMVVRMVRRIPSVIESDRYYDVVLGIRNVQTVTWQDVMRRLVDTGPAQWDHLKIVNCITRADNYYVALYNDRVIDPVIHVPCLGPRRFMPVSLQWNIQTALRQSYVFSPDRPVSVTRDTINVGASNLRQWFRLLALLNLVLFPVILAYRAALYVFQHANEWRRKPGSLVIRQWSPWARWTLRQYCELPHSLDERLAKAHAHTTAYLRSFGSAELLRIAARFALVVCGGFLFINVAFAFVFDEEYLTSELTPGRSVAFWMGLATMVMVGAESLATPPPVGDTPSKHLGLALEELRYRPSHWDNDPTNPKTRNEVADLHTYHLAVIIEEILSTVLTPYVLAVTLPEQAERISEFFATMTVRDPLIGDVCKHGMLQGNESAVDKVNLSMLLFREQNPGWADDLESQMVGLGHV